MKNSIITIIFYLIVSNLAFSQVRIGRPEGVPIPQEEKVTGIGKILSEVKIEISTAYGYQRSHLSLGRDYWRWSIPDNITDPILNTVSEFTPQILKDILPINQGIDWLDSQFDKITFSIEGFADQKASGFSIRGETRISWRFISASYQNHGRRMADPNPYLDPSNIGKFFSSEGLLELETENLTRLNDGNAYTIGIGLNVDHWLPKLQEKVLYTTKKQDQVVWGLKISPEFILTYDPYAIGLRANFAGFKGTLIDGGIPSIVANITSEFIAGNNAILGVVNGGFTGGRLRTQGYLGKKDKWNLAVHLQGELLYRNDAKLSSYSAWLTYTRNLNKRKAITQEIEDKMGIKKE